MKGVARAMNDSEILRRLKAAVVAGACNMDDLVALAEIAAAASVFNIRPEDIAAAVAQAYPHHVPKMQKVLDDLDKPQRATGGLVAPGLALPYVHVREGEEMFVPISGGFSVQPGGDFIEYPRFEDVPVGVAMSPVNAGRVTIREFTQKEAEDAADSLIEAAEAWIEENE